MTTGHIDVHSSSSWCNRCHTNMPMSPLVSKIVETMREPIVRQVSARGNNNRMNEHQEKFIQAIAGTNDAPVHRHPTLVSKNVEEKCSSTKEVSKWWAALSMLPPATQTSYWPVFQDQVSIKTHWDPFWGYWPLYPCHLHIPLMVVVQKQPMAQFEPGLAWVRLFSVLTGQFSWSHVYCGQVMAKALGISLLSLCLVC